MIVKEKDTYSSVCPQNMKNGCLGSCCMAWRWAAEDNPDYVPPNMQTISDPRKNKLFVRSKTHGYCGMAGSV